LKLITPTLFESHIMSWRFDYMKLAFFTRLPRISSLAGLALVGTALAVSQSASAGTIDFGVANQTPVTTAGGTGTIDVVVTETGSSDSLFQFEVELSLAGGSPISLGAATETGKANPGGFAGGTSGYVFGQSTYANSADISPNNGGAQIGVNSPTDVGNSDSSVSAGTPLGGSTQYGLMQLTFSVPADTPAGSYTLTFNQDPGFNGDYVDTVSPSDSNIFLPGVLDAAIVVSSVATPEPGSIVMMTLGALGLIGFGVRRARRA
jgi:hypothetical protein